METNTHRVPPFLPSETHHHEGKLQIISSVTSHSPQHKNKPESVRVFLLTTAFFITKTAYIKHFAKGMQRC